VLRPFAMNDEAAIARYALLPDYRRHLGPDHPDPRQFVRNNLHAGDHEPGWVITLDDARDGETIVGTIFLGVRPDERAAELACLLDPAHWHNGYALEAARAVIDHAFAALDVDTVTARADPSNAASIRAMERLGFVAEPTDRDEVVYRLSR
jgi:[ribosomal protein S5]-alanine N-acetyltransferase